MKYLLFLTSFFLFTANAQANIDPCQFEHGEEIEYDFYSENNQHIYFRAILNTKSSSPKHTLHRYEKPEIYFNDKKIKNVVEAVYTEIAQRLGYEYLSWAPKETTGLIFNRKYLDYDFQIKRASDKVVMRPDATISFYHPECSNWVY